MKEKTRIYLYYLAEKEKQNLTDSMAFLREGEDSHKTEVSKKIFCAVAKEVYNKEKELDPLWDNGHYPDGYIARAIGNRYLYTIIEFDKKDLTEKALRVLGSTDSSNFPYHYAISVDKESRELYLVSLQDMFCPNWNNEHEIQTCVAIKDVDFPVIKNSGLIYRIDGALHAALNAFIYKDLPKYTEGCDGVAMIVKDQHGNYKEISASTIDALFREYADKYTGYRNYRDQMASEWEIIDDTTRQRFEDWKENAKGLKSDFDKFYRGGIVD